MNETLQSLLAGPVAAQALETALTLAFGALLLWLRRRLSAVAVLNDNWVYAKPVVAAAVASAREAAKAGTWSSALLRDLTLRGLAALSDEFRLHEGAEPPAVLLAAVAGDIEDTVTRAVGEPAE